METYETFVFIVIGLILFVGFGLIVWIAYRGSIGTQTRYKRDAGIMRGRSMIEHAFFGPLEVTHVELLSESRARITGVDVHFNKHLFTAYYDEIVPSNVWQALVGTNPQFKYVPSKKRLLNHIKAQEYDDAHRSATVEARAAEQLARSETKLATSNKNFEVEKILDQVAKLNKMSAGGAPVVVKR